MANKSDNRFDLDEVQIDALEAGFKKIADLCVITEHDEIARELRAGLAAFCKVMRRSDALVFTMLALNRGLTSDTPKVPDEWTEPTRPVSESLFRAGYVIRRLNIRETVDTSTGPNGANGAEVEIAGFDGEVDNAAEALMCAVRIAFDVLYRRMGGSRDAAVH